MSGRVRLGVRWTVGDVHLRGFEALRLSIAGAWRLFGRAASYVVCVNSVSASEARRRTGPVRDAVLWREVSREDLPGCLDGHVDSAMAEGVGWKFSPLRCFPDRHELALDNDCILWDLPPALATWLSGQPERCLLAEDVRPAFGQFARFCGEQPRNSGIRGVPPGFDLADALARAIARNPVTLASELDEQGLQVAALSGADPLVVTTTDVSICSPFHPNMAELGRCGAHFVGLNCRAIEWDYYDRPALAWLDEHWQRLKPEVERRLR